MGRWHFLPTYDTGRIHFAEAVPNWSVRVHSRYIIDDRNSSRAGTCPSISCPVPSTRRFTFKAFEHVRGHPISNSVAMQKTNTAC